MSNPIVSLCMPTNGVVEWVFPVLDSIYKQGCDNNEFEIIITDNGTNKEFKDKIKTYNQQHFNLHYFETDALPFINEIESYKRAEGQLIKFVNHRTLLVNGALKQFINLAKNNINTKPVIYFANGMLKKEKKIYEYESFDQFVKNLSYWSSWSTGMTIWKEDFDKERGEKFQQQYREALEQAEKEGIVRFKNNYDFYVLAYPEKVNFFRVRRQWQNLLRMIRSKI